MRRAWPLLLLPIVCCGCVKEDADRLQRVANRAGSTIRAAADDAWDRLTPRLERLKSTPDQALEERVRYRLTWDQTLAGAQIEPRASGSTVELHGTLADAGQRRQAVQLTQTTVGVETVVDHLTAPK